MQFPTRIKPCLKAIAAAALLTPLGLWLLVHGWPQRHLYYRNYRFNPIEARRLAAYPQAMLAYGDEAWQNLRLDEATGFYRQAAVHDVMNMDAWLRLARTEAARGQTEEARAILAFVTAIAGETSRWQSSIALLAHELDMAATFRESINFLISHGVETADSMNLLEAHCRGVNHCLKILDKSNRGAYLKWLMHWERVAESRLVWQHLWADKAVKDEILLKYIDFLLSTKYVHEAAAIWRMHTGTEGMTNSSFEYKISGKGFDWRVGREENGYWRFRQTQSEGRKHTIGAKITFFGKSNLDFYHLYQIIPVRAKTRYRLTYWWRGLRLDTDQGPFLELSGYGCKDFYARGPVLLGSSNWREERIEFTVSPGCQAVKLRLRRMPSNRFNNKIHGTLWLDDFTIKSIGPDAKNG
jgi:hypothetical protein